MSEQSLIPQDGEAIAVELTKEQIMQIEAALDRSVAAAEEAAELLKAAAGPTPAPIPAQLLTKIHMGTGYFREARDTIRRMFREWNSVVRQAQCEHRSGTVCRGRRVFCKLCDWEFVRRPGYGWVPMERTGNE